MLDVVVVGGGSAGLSAALVLGRSRRRTLVVDGGPPRNAPSPAAHSFFTRDGASPLELLSLGRDQLRPYQSVEIRWARVKHIERTGGHFAVALEAGNVEATRRVLLATGVVDALPAIEGMDGLWGRSVLHCPFCHGWEVRDEPVAVYSRGREAIAFARLILGWSRDVVLCSDGPADLEPEGRDFLNRHGIRLNEERIVRLEGEGELERIVFGDGSALERAALFVRPAQEPRSTLARQLACDHTDDGSVRVDDDGRTSVAGVYAAGDMTSRTAQQVILAAASGARAAIAIQRELVAEDFA